MIDDMVTGWEDAEFRKSSFSGGESGSCVEVARQDALFGVRDSKHGSGPVLTFGETQGRAFVAAVKRLG